MKLSLALFPVQCLACFSIFYLQQVSDSIFVTNLFSDLQTKEDNPSMTDIESTLPTVYFVLTAALNKSPKRCGQYARSLQILLNETKQMLTEKSYKIVLVEGNGQRTTCLDNNVGVEVLYTNNSAVVTGGDKGTNELLDVTDAISYFGMKDTDYLVKMTGRYYLNHNSTFLATLNQIDLQETRALVKFGSFSRPSNKPMRDCVTGLIMLPVSSIQTIWRAWNNLSMAEKGDPIEWLWAAAALELPPHQVLAIQGTMGIYISPGQDDQFRLK